MDTPTFQLHPIDPSSADTLRAAGGPVYVADAKPGYPCRQCLRDAEVGETMMLVSHDPFSKESPYRSASPIFLHQDPCEPPGNLADVPDQLALRQLSVRSFDRDDMMIDAAVIEGHDLSQTILGLFRDPRSERIDVHNAVRGCWATSVVRV